MYSDKENLGFGIRVDDMFPGAWSFGISLSHSMDETYVLKDNCCWLDLQGV